MLGTAFVLGTARGLEPCGCGPGRDGAGRARRDGEEIVYGEMEQPIPTWAPLRPRASCWRRWAWPRSGLPVEVYDNGPRHAYVELPDADAVAALAPDMRALAALGTFGVSCFACSTAGAGQDPDVRAGARRRRGPGDRSAAGPLAVHLARHGRIAFGQTVEIHQGAEIGRPSLLQAVGRGLGRVGDAGGRSAAAP